MPSSYTFSWTPEGYKNFKPGQLLDYSGGNGLRALETGDRLFIVNLREGTVYLLGAMTVGQVVNTVTAKKIRDVVYEQASHHAIAAPGSASEFDFRPIPEEQLRTLRFVTAKGDAGLKYKNGRPDSQTLRGLRRVTDATSAYLDSLAAARASSSPGKSAESLALLTQPAAVNAAIAEYKQLGRSKFLEKYGHKKSPRFLIFDGTNHFDSRAVAGVAVGYQHPHLGPLSEEHIADDDQAVANKLTSLGFKIVEQGHGVEWTAEENAAIVTAYFDMLGVVARGEKLNKAAQNAALRAKLQRRTRGSIERKLMNVTAALAEMSKPTLDGYAPNSNRQDDLTPAIEAYLSKNQESFEATLSALEQGTDPPQENFDGALEDAPRPKISGKNRPSIGTPGVPRKLDFAGRDEANRALGLKGEQWVVGYEKHRLIAAGLHHLAAKVEHVALTQGDGLGYDVRSFDIDGQPIFIEVKTTNAGAMSPFMLSPNEVEASERLGPSYRLYRVHSFKVLPKVFVLRGSLRSLLLLEPSQYRARIRPVEEE